MLIYARYASRRLAAGVATVAIASFIMYLLMDLAPGDPATELAGGRATPRLLAAIRHRYGFDRPVLVRYEHWVTGAIHGNLGISTQFRQSVSSLLAPRIGITLELVVFAFVIVCVVGVGIGILPGRFRRSNLAVTLFSGIGIAIPSFVAALILVYIFALKLNVFPVLDTSTGGGLFNTVRSLTLPAVSLALAWAAYVAQISRASILREAQRDHVDAARIRGGTEAQVFRRHVLRNSTPSIVTVTALSLAGLLTGSVVVETVFGIGGIGSLLVSSVSAKDNNVVLAIVLIFVVGFVVATTVAELVQLAVDPRVARAQAS